jgi:anti-sigma regulatory factor (Ser/Thr protein kinase)
MGRVSIPVFGEECEFEVVVTDDGFTYPGCTRVDKDITCDPADPESPFKGTKGSIFIWFQPQ